MKSFVNSNATITRKPRCLLIKEIFTNTLDIKEPSVIILSKFEIECGITLNDIYLAVLTYLSDKPVDDFGMYYNDYGIDRNTLAWMKYHDINFQVFKKCVNFKQKRNCRDTCVICLSQANSMRFRLNTFDDTTVIVTMSPQHMSRDRVGQTITERGCHFVVWAGDHSLKISHKMDLAPMYLANPDIFDLVNVSYDCCNYYHGYDQYGHSHFHVISGVYHKIRAGEMLRKALSCVKNSTVLEFSDMFHPINKFFSNSSESGQDCLIATFVIVRLRLDLSKYSNDFIVRYLKSAFPIVWDDVFLLLDDGVF